MHGIFPVNWDNLNGREGLLTAGFTGVRLYKLGTDGNWKHTEILKGSAFTSTVSTGNAGLA